MLSAGSLVLYLSTFACLCGDALGARSRELRQSQQVPIPIFPPGLQFGGGKPPEDRGELVFTLRHIYHHGSQKYPNLHKYLDIDPEKQTLVTSDYGKTYEFADISLPVRASSTRVERMEKRSKSDVDGLLAYAEYHGHAISLPADGWTTDEVAGPNVTDKETIISFAKMAANAYVQDHDASDWQPVGGGFNYTDDFGWENDGLRGHIFADETNGTIVIGLKGTSPAVFDGADTTGNDKLNDNLFGSCCCAQQGPWTWKQVCDCRTDTYTCNSTCLVKSLRKKGHYYWAVRDLYHNVTERYPGADVWLSGHSLGGVVSSLLGLTYGLPTLTYEAFPYALASSRLGLPVPPGYRVGSHQSRAGTGIYHFGHTADPIFMGSCNGASSYCAIGGYAFEGVCHTGKTCTYDTVGDLGWRVGIGTHKIYNVIRDVLKKYDTVPECVEDVECSDCFNWKFFESNGSDPITTTTSSSSTRTTTRTRTETCKTPGWWGCLDESSTTTKMSTSTSTSSTSTSTCKTPGWFGCKDSTPISSTVSTAVTTSSVSNPVTTTCETPGWFGCHDPTTAMARPSSTIIHSTASATATATATHTSAFPGVPISRRRTCISRHWYGSCKVWSNPSKVDL